MATFQPLDAETFKKLSARSERSPLPFAIEVRFDRRSRKIKLLLSTGVELSFDAHRACGLEDASDEDLAGVEIEGAGGSICFPRLDADFSVARLLEGFLGPIDWARRERAAKASRENGKRGGRPRKIPAAA
jgi:hypothetical protein